MNYQILFHPSGERLLWGISIDVIFTTVITISIFIFGYLLNRLYDYRKEIKRLNELEEYFYSLFELLKQPINKQIKNLKEMADNIEDKKKNQFGCKLDVDFDASNLLNITHSDLHKIFVVRKKGGVETKTEHFSSMANTLNYINFLRENIFVDYQNYNNSFNQYAKIWTESCQSIITRYDTFCHINKKEKTPLSNDNFLYDLDRLIFNWNQYEDSKNIYVTQEYFIIPLKKLCKQHHQDERANTILQLVVAAKTSFESIESTKNIYIDQYKENAATLKSKFESFESAVKYFRGNNGKR